jgi:hypothetical protein
MKRDAIWDVLTLERWGGIPSKDMLLCIPGALKK